ncbi:FkbM family methyltransferase [Nonomuraea sp. NPDC026600]|uniref:FkbM family methyltransferase n=1 Tax=Nonomuraea sp. NPDC026600 TaxID=3155363 RepID=UPI0033F8FE50
MISTPALSALRAYIRHAPGRLGKAALVERTLNQRLEQRPVTTTARTRFGAVFPVTTSDLIQRYLYLFGIWEPHLTAWLRRRLHPGDTFIDVGANIGYFTVLASRLVGPSGHVVAIEACPQFHQALTQNLRANRCGNVRSLNTAVYDTATCLTFYLEHATNLGATTIIRPRTAQSSFAIQAQTLPQILTDTELTQARLIKIDVEGAEGAAVRGLTPLLDRLRPDAEFIIEVTPRRLAKLGHSIDDILQPLRAHGFHPYRLANDYTASSYSAALRRPALPTRWHQPITEMSDLVFSRIDADTLT